MSHALKDLVDLEILQQLTEDLHGATGIPSAVLAADGEVLTRAGWQPICTRFHRRHPEARQACQENNRKLREPASGDDPFLLHRCAHGLTDAACPVVIEGQTVAHVFSGQVFTRPPDAVVEAEFRARAARYGFDQAAYLEALHQVPVRDEGSLRATLAFLANLARLVAGLGLARLREQAALEAERRSEAWFRLLFENLSEGILVADPESRRFVMANDALYRLLGYSGAEILELGIEDIHPPETLPDALAAFASQASGEAPLAPDVPLLRKDGEVRYADINSAPIEMGGKRYLVGLFRDVSERHRADAERSEMESRLRQADRMEAIGTFAGGIAHDFNNVLTPILACSDLALLYAPEDGPVRDELHAIQDAAERARELVRQILVLARGEEERPYPLDPGPVVKEVLKFLRSTIPSTVELRAEIQSGQIQVEASPIQIHQLVMNLCTNAWHAVRDTGGAIEVRLESHPLARADAVPDPTLEPGDYVRLRVRDTGPGIPEHLRERLFEPYVTTKKPGEGTGLGLSVVRGIVTSLGGAITFETRPGEETIFDVYLPVVAQKPLPTIPGRKELQTGSGHVLLVDDEPAIVRVTTRILQKLGYTVTGFTASGDALEELEGNRASYDLVISDQTMPGLTGEALTRAIGQRWPDLPVILCTGYSDRLDTRLAREAGARAFLEKPLTAATLSRAVGEVLEDVRR